MRVGISAMGKDEKSDVSEVGGRSPYYLIFEDGKLIKAIENPYVHGGRAGIKVAEMLKNEGVEIVVCGRVGRNMKDVLEQGGVKVKEVENKKVEEVLKELNEV